MNRTRAAWTEYLTGERRGNKFEAQRTDGYDSKGEARLGQEIQFMMQAGELIEVIRQAPFPLYGAGGTKVCVHRVDFLLVFKDGHPEAWEFKGAEQALWKLKMKLFLDNYPGVPYVLRRKA